MYICIYVYIHISYFGMRFSFFLDLQLLRVRFHARDTYGNRMLDDFHSQLWYHTVSDRCDPRDPYDPLCKAVDEAGTGTCCFGMSFARKLFTSKNLESGMLILEIIYIYICI